MHKKHLAIQIKPNFFLLAAWGAQYTSLVAVIYYLPLGQYLWLVYFAVIMLALYTLVDRVLPILPFSPKAIEFSIDNQGKVILVDDKKQIHHWKFTWRSKRLLVLTLFHQSWIMQWLPIRSLWLSPHNTGKEAHRHLRIISRFGDRIPVTQYDKVEGNRTTS